MTKSYQRTNKTLWLFVLLTSVLTGCVGLSDSRPTSSNPPKTRVTVIIPQASPTLESTETMTLPDNVKSEPKDIVETQSSKTKIIEVEETVVRETAVQETATKPKQDLTRPNDLWDALRTDFTLVYSNPNDPIIARFEKWYQNNPKYFQRLSERAYWYMPYILQEIKARGMPVEIALLPAIESAYRAEAVSRSNAVGMWQFIAATGSRFGLRRDWWMEGRRDLVESTRAALDYLEFLEETFDGNWEHVFAAYNAGEGTLRKQIRRNQSKNKPISYPHLELRKETREYVPKLFAVRNIIANPEKFGISLKKIPNEQTLAIVDLKTQTDLTVAASLIPLSAKELLQFNQGYKRGVTPPNGPHHIVIPAQHEQTLVAKLSKLSLQQRLRWARHQVRKGEYLGRIARKHGVTVESIMHANQLSSNLIKPGQELKIPISTGYFQYAKASVSNVKLKAGDRIYTVRKGDSLWRISQSNGISLSSILQWNGMSKSSVLFPGQQLIIGKSS
jgi:membrane-bound lytic murein transglycosylase D